MFAVLALFAQIAGAAALPDCCQDDGLVLGVICSVDHAPPPPPTSPQHRHDRDCAVCPLCAAVVGHVAVLEPSPALPAPREAVVLAMALPPPARAPPPGPYRPGKPRGPPLLT